MDINKNLINLLISVAIALAVWLGLIYLGDMVRNYPALRRIVVLLGGTSGGYIQFLCYIAFSYAVVSLVGMQKDFKREFDGFDLNLLPNQDQLVLTPEEVAQVKLSVIDMEKRGFVYKVSDFIKKACTQYRNDESVSETMQVLDVQIENDKEVMEGSLSMIRYLMSAIMSLGFIGTLIGLSEAIGNAHLAKTEEGMSILTSFLNLAFDTTLVALGLGLILNFFYHRFIGDIDRFYAQSKSYIVDNLISRIYVPR